MLEYVYFILAKLNISKYLAKLLSHDKVTILIYHNPKPDVFSLHALYLYENYNFITLDAFLNAIENKSSKTLPKRALLVTFDDGHKGNIHLLDIFKKFKIHPTIYICTGIIGTSNLFWWQAVKSRDEINELKQFNNRDREHILNIHYNYCPLAESSDITSAALSLEDINKMVGHVNFQSHTKFHPILTTLDESEKEREYLDSLNYLKNTINPFAHSIAYPNGDYLESDFDYLKQLGYKSGRTTNPGWNSLRTNPYELRGIGISDDASLAKLQFQLTGIFSYLVNILTGGRISGKKKMIKPKQY